MKRKVLCMLIIMILFGCTSPTNKDVKEEVDEPYIDFNTMLFDVDWNSNFDPLSDKYINDSNGIITYEGEVNTKIRSDSPKDYRFIVKYTVTSEHDKNLQRRYNIQYRVKKEPFFDHEGYPTNSVYFYIEPTLFKKLENRFVLDEGTADDPSIVGKSGYLVVLYIDNNKKITLAYGTDGIFCVGGYESTNLWEGNYELVKDKIYHVTNFRRYKLANNSCVVKEAYGESYEFFFILSSLEKEGNLYYFMEYPENGYDETMNSFYNSDSSS